MRPARRLGLRFLCCYTVLYWLYAGGPIAHVVLGIRTRPQSTAKPPIAHIIVPWIAAHVLHLANPITTFTNGSGDTTYDWLLTSLLALVAAVAGAIWASIDRKAPYDANLRLWLRFGIRTFLAFELLSYGLAKVIPTQFGAFGNASLAKPLGSFAPMGVLWISMASSTGYTMFAGTIECLAGALLLVPRLSKAGALLATIALANVFALNVFYDVPVKLLSLHLLLFAIFLAAPELPRLRDVLITDGPVPPPPVDSFADRRSIGPLVYVTWVLAIVFAWFDVPRNLAQRATTLSHLHIVAHGEPFHLISQYPIFYTSQSVR